MEPSRLAYNFVRVAGSPAVEFCLDPVAGDGVAAWLLDHDWIDEPVMRAFLGCITPGARVIDLGCHLGTFSLPAAALGAEVIAVDASPRHVHLLRMAARRNGFDSLQVVHGAVSDAEEPVQFIEHGIHGRVWRSDDGGRPTITAPAVSVDDLIERAGWDGVDAIKMDIEGSEPAALRSMTRTHARGVRPAMVFECNGAMLPQLGSSIQALREAIAALGYEALMIDHLRPLTLVETPVDAVQTECVTDYIAFVSRPAELEQRWTVEPPFSREQTLARLLETAADAAIGYRRYAAEVLRTGPAWLRAAPSAELAARALEVDFGGEIGFAFERARESSEPASLADSLPAQGVGAEVAVLARDVGVWARTDEPDRPADSDGPPVERLAVRNVSFHLQRGQALAVLADDEAAGSALLQAIAGIVPAPCGELTVPGRAILVSDIASVFEPELGIGDNLVLFAAFLGCDVRALGSSVAHVAERAGVGHLLDTPLGEMSTEIEAQLALTVALEWAEPKLFLIDRLPAIEDAAFRSWFRDRSTQLQAAGTALIQVVGDRDQLLVAAERAIWIEGGQARASGYFESVLEVRRRGRGNDSIAEARTQ